MPGDKEYVAPPSRLFAKVGSRIETVHVDLLGLAQPARDEGDHDGESRSDEDNEDCSDVQAHVVVF
jgi:hypothetical protein